MSISRRTFIRQKGCAALGLAGVLNAIAQLRMVHNASAQIGGNDYKALVCIFLYGGNDSNNTIIPTGAGYSTYNDQRGLLAIDENLILPMNYIDPLSRTFGMHPSLGDAHLTSPSVHNLFQTGKLAVVANVGTLVNPVTQQQYFSKTVPLPPQLFSHSDQQVHWQSSIPDQPFATGWGGRMADRMYGENVGAQTSMQVSLAGHNDFMVGRELAASQLHLTPEGPLRIENYGNPASGVRYDAFDNIMTNAVSNLFAKEYQSRVASARANNEFISARIEQDLDLPADYPEFPDNDLGDQLNMIAQMISLRESLNQKRQLFFAAIGGFDTHANQGADQPALMSEISTAMGAFHQATVKLGVENEVTTFTASDFNRTYTANGATDAAGSDHAWGGHAMVMGGAVNGGSIYGSMPDHQLGSIDDTELHGNGNTSRGRWIPKLSVDEYAATLARWYGLTPEHINEVFPNLGRFATPDLGFLV